jgi:hypothetical protein
MARRGLRVLHGARSRSFVRLLFHGAGEDGERLPGPKVDKFAETARAPAIARPVAVPTPILG